MKKVFIAGLVILFVNACVFSWGNINLKSRVYKQKQEIKMTVLSAADLAQSPVTPSYVGANLGTNYSDPQYAQVRQGIIDANTGGGGGGGGYAPAAPAINYAQLAQYDQAIGNANAGLNRLGAQLNSGNSSIDASWQNALNQLLLSKNQGQATYDTNKHDTATNYVGAKNTIGANAGSTLSGLQRLLGSRGAGGSSAYLFGAPGAVGRQATLQRADASNTNAHNNQALDTEWGNFMTGYNNQVSGANTQRNQQRDALNQQIENSRGTLLQTLAQLQGQRAQAAGGNAVGAAQPYLDQANAALDRASNYHTTPITYQTQAYQAPSLASYNSNPGPAPTYQGQPASNDYFSPYLAALTGKKQPGALGTAAATG